MRAELLVGSEEFWTRLQADLLGARRRAYLQTFSFEGDAVGLELAETLLGSSCPDRRILVDSFTRIIQNDRLIHHPKALWDRVLRAEVRMTRRMIGRLRAGGVGLRFTNPLGLGLLRVFHRNHKKLAVVDDRVAYVGGINFCEHNFEWHDLMLRIESPEVAAFLADDFLATWERRPRGRFLELPGLRLHTLSGRDNPAAFAPLFRLLRDAERSIDVVSPYLAPPFTDHLRAARARGIRVRILSPAENNRRILRRFIMAESDRAGFDLRLYPERMNHTKAMLVDDRILVAGSSNFDTLSYRLLEEIVLFTTLPDLVECFRERVLVPDLAGAIRHRPRPDPVTLAARTLPVRALTGLIPLLSHL